MRVGFVLFEDLEELDLVGPWEVWGMAQQSRPEISCFTVSQDGRGVRCSKGLRLEADYSFASAPPIDVLVVPGGRGTRREVDNPEMLAWLERTWSGCAWVTSVCTGSLLLSATRQGRGKRVTTHWGAIEFLRDRGEAGEVVADERYVRDGNLVTAAGVSAGIDMALWLLGEIWDPDLAREVQRGMEYDPQPPYP